MMPKTDYVESRAELTIELDKDIKNSEWVGIRGFDTIYMPDLSE